MAPVAGSQTRRDELVFLPLGGVGEIGMNLGLYGFGPARARQWLIVDFGVAFAHSDLPGVDLIFPDIAYLEERKAAIAGIVITHAHEDHFGALIDLWPRLRVPVYATAFTAGLLNAKLASEPGAAVVPVTIVKPGERFLVGSFDVEYINVAHSIPESNALAIRTPLGTVIHTGDWKLDDHPTVGLPTDEARLAAIGAEGVLAMVCDSTNAMRDGRSPSETDVARELADIVKQTKGRIAFTTFASNVGRIKSIALAAQAAGRDVVICGRALRRAIDVATELHMLDGTPPFLDEEAFQHIPRDKVVAILTGSQGETRAALARVASGDHPRVYLDAGDTLVFSARAIPGNEIDINRIINGLAERGVHIITDRDRLVHVSGHPRRDELRKMYEWVRPRIAIPVHGEPMHLAAHVEFARALGVPDVARIRNGVAVRLAPDFAISADAAEAGRLYKDGRLIDDLAGVGVPERRKLSFAGHVAVSLVTDSKGEQLVDPDVMLTGLPQKDGAGRPMEEIVIDAVLSTFDSLPRPQRRDPDVLAEAVRRAVRSTVNEAWGKKPVCTVFVAVV
jgi:ribonuclease J